MHRILRWAVFCAGKWNSDITESLKGKWIAENRVPRFRVRGKGFSHMPR